MSDCNQEYFVMVEDNSIQYTNYQMGYYGSERTHLMTKTHFNQPIRFDIEVDDAEKKNYIRREPEDVIFLEVYGLLLSDKIKEKHFSTFAQEDTIIHNAYIVSPDGEYFEGYWFLPTPNKPKDWLDKDKSNIAFDDDPPYEAFYIKSYYLNCPAINDISIDQRHLITWDNNDYGTASHLIHKELVNILKPYKRNLKFVPLLEFNIGMEMGGSKIPKTAI